MSNLFFTISICKPLMSIWPCLCNWKNSNMLVCSFLHTVLPSRHTKRNGNLPVCSEVSAMSKFSMNSFNYGLGLCVLWGGGGGGGGPPR